MSSSCFYLYFFSSAGQSYKELLKLQTKSGKNIFSKNFCFKTVTCHKNAVRG